VSEQQAEQSGGDLRSADARPAVPTSADALPDSVPDSAKPAEQDAHCVESPGIAPVAEAAKAEEPKADAPKAELAEADKLRAEVSKPEVSDPETPKSEATGTEAVKTEPVQSEPVKGEPVKSEAARSEPVKAAPVKAEAARPRELLVMSPREDWKRVKANLEKGSYDKASFDRGRYDGRKSAPDPEPQKQAPPANNGGRRFAVLAAMLALAVIAGAAGGAFATVGLSHFTETAAAGGSNTSALEASVARIDADIVALKAGLEQTTNAGLAQFNKTSDRLERIEKAQSEPNAKLARLSDAVDRLRATASGQAASATAASTTVAAAAPKDVTGTVTAPAGAQPLPMPQASPTAAGATPKTEVGRLPTVDNWVLRDVSHGSALIEGRTGLYEVFAGDPVPGLGRVEAIRKQDGRWVVITPKGLIVAR